MHIEGEGILKNCLDVPKLEAFLREQGMSEGRIKTLKISFVKEMKRGKTEACGAYSILKHQITLSESEFTGETSEELLLDLNETLMHEISHALDKKHKWIFLSKLALYMLPSIVFVTIALTFFSTNLLVYLSILAFIYFVWPMIWEKQAYKLDIGEKRARAFEERYGKSVILFRLEAMVDGLSEEVFNKE